ncbi:MAG: PEP/pyruvate-binding domain-containing protein [Actinomycetota bacterium]
MTPHTIVLDGAGVGPLVAGGKGSALDRLVALDARIPATGVITTSAYEAFEAVPEIAAFVDELKTAEIPDPTRHDEHRRMVDEMFLSVPLPDPVSAEIDSLALTVGADALVAVRSSATAEDLESASFAGQYESYLNVEASGVHDAVRLVWASLWYPAPRAYRRFRQIDEHDLTMAVVVMRMLDPSEAGVLFTVDPGGGDDAVRLEVVQGLGEQLVSGEKTPDAYVIDRETMVDEFAAISAPLRDLATEALRLEEALGAPQDIEFAVHDGDLYLVQARPITTVVDASRTDDGFDFSCGDQTTYTTAGIAETMPGVLSPLSWGINSWLLENGFRNLFDLLGGGADVLTHEHALIGRFRGRAALNLDAMSDAAASIPGGSPDELQRQYFGEAVPREDGEAPSEPEPLSRGAGASQGVRVLRARRTAVEESEVVIQAVDNLMEDEPGLVRMDDDGLFAYWNRLMHLGQRVAAAEVAVAAMASAAHRSVEVFLERHMSKSEAAASARALTSIEGTERRSRIALALDDITTRIRNDADLRAMADEDWETTREAFEDTVPGHRIVLDFMEALRRAGSTSIFAGPTWDEVPQLAWLTIYTELLSPPELSGAAERRADVLAALEHQLTSTSKWRWTRFVTGQLLDVRRRFLRREAADAAELLHRRELTKAALLIIGGVVRHANVEMGIRLHERGVLESPEDVEMLSVGELRALVGGEAPTHETIALRRRRNLEASQAEPLPLVWTGEPPELSAADISGEHFEGWSASPGRYEGRARIVDSPATSELRRGEVLIATTTDASWAPLFMAAGAVVVEQGGPLSHAAIVARELGMPAVANVPGLIARLRQEAEAPLITVDGTDGVVVIHRTDEEQSDIDLTGSAASDTVAAGVAPVRTSDERWDDSGSGFNVFVAGLMGAGALMSILMGLTESISSIRGRERLRRQAAPKALMMSEGTIHGYEHVLSRPTGLRPRRDYLLASLVLYGVAAVLLATSLDSYLSKASGSVVAFAVAATGVATVAAIATTSLVAARTWPAVPPIVRRVAPGRPAREHSVWASVSVPARRAIYAMLALVAVGGLLAIVAESWLLEIDEPIYFDWLEAREDNDRWGPGWLNNLGQPIVIIPLSVAIGLATVKRRIVALAWPAAIIGGGLANLVLSWVVHRERPPFSAHAGEFTSYPGGHSIQLTLLMGMVPLAVEVVSESRLAGRVTAVLAAGVWVVAWADTVRTGGHWPIDQVAGLLIALSLLTVVYSAANRERQDHVRENRRHRTDPAERH